MAANVARPVGKLTALKPAGLVAKPVGKLTAAGGSKPVGKLTAVAAPVAFSADTFFQGVADREGSGDTATSVPTAHFGVTESAAKAVGLPFDVNMTEEKATEIGTKYINKLEQDFSSKVDGWGSLPLEVKEGAVDAAYNMGPQVYKFEGFITALENKDIPEAAKQLLDTANIDGKTSKGLAKRRAELYNQMVGEKKIDTVEALPDGTLKYMSGKVEVFSYKKAPHSTSTAGVIDV